MESIFCEPPVPLVRKENRDYAHFRAFCTQQPHCLNYPWVSTRLRVRKWILVRQFIALCVAGLVAGCSKTACVCPGLLEVHVEYGRRVLLDTEVVYKVVMRSSWKLRRRRSLACGRPPLPPQHLMVTAAVLAVAAIAVSLMIVAGGLSWMVPGEEEARTWDRLKCV